jgi:secreted Zn-dependent insulinase-like peptidase
MKADFHSLLAALSLLLADCWNDALAEDAYLADSACLSSAAMFEEYHNGLEISVAGFSHRLPVLTLRIFQVRAP